MLTSEQIDRVNSRLVSIQIISFAILMGAVFFACVVFAIIDWNNFNHNAKLLTAIGALTGISMYVLAFVAASIFAASSFESSANDAKHNPDLQNKKEYKTLDECVGSLLTARILFVAVIEGAIFLNLMTFMLEQSSIALLIAGFGIILLVVTFPRKSGLIDKLSDQLKHIQHQSQIDR